MIGTDLAPSLCAPIGIRAAARTVLHHNGAVLADPPLLEGPVVTLRPLRSGDADAITHHCQDPEISRWTVQIPYPYLRSDAEEFIASGVWALAVCDATTGFLAGCIGVPDVDEDAAVCEVGYWIGRDARGRGLASAALAMLASWLVSECGVHEVELLIKPANAASERVAANAGFSDRGRVSGRRIADANLWSLAAAGAGRR